VAHGRMGIDCDLAKSLNSAQIRVNAPNHCKSPQSYLTALPAHAFRNLVQQKRNFT
jgi:uncharacterized protein (UPF0276 family)